MKMRLKMITKKNMRILTYDTKKQALQALPQGRV